jgi:hypothetical protein
MSHSVRSQELQCSALERTFDETLVEMLVSCTDMPPALQPTNERDRRASPKREARAEPLLSWAFPGERERRNLFFQGPNLFCRCPQETLPSPSFANFAFLFSLSTSHLSQVEAEPTVAGADQDSWQDTAHWCVHVGAHGCDGMGRRRAQRAWRRLPDEL